MTLTRIDLLARMVSLIRDNIRGEITADRVRTVIADVADSTLNPLTDRVSLSLLAEDVLAVLGGGLDPTKYQGTWEPASDTPTIPAAAVGNNGFWYLTTQAGTAPGNAAGTYGAGDRVRSNGTVWQRMPAPPTVVAPGSIDRFRLAPELAQLMTPTESPEWAYAIVDPSGRVAFGIRPDGTTFGLFDQRNESVGTPALQDGAVTLAKLAQSIVSVLAVDTGDSGELVYAIVDSQNRIALGVQKDGTLIGRLPLPDGSITTQKIAAGAVVRSVLSPDLGAAIPEEMDRSDIVYAIMDAQNRIAFGIKGDGTLIGRLPLPEGAVVRSSLSPDLGVAIPEEMDRSDIVYAIVDAQNRIAFGVRGDGTLIGRSEVSDGSVTRPKLSASLDELLPQPLADATGFRFAIVDQEDRIGIGIKSDGTVVGKMAIGAGTVTKPSLNGELCRLIVPSNLDRVVVEDDDNGIRSRTFEIPGITEAAGSMFAPFAPTPTRSLRGINTTGITLEFRRSAGLLIRGKRYRGTWAPADGSPGAWPFPGDWWNVTASGTFAGITWADGDRMHAWGAVSGVGPKYAKVFPGELCYCGEFDPGSHSPTHIRDGDLWQASAPGTFSDISFAIRDILIRESGVWGKVASDPITTVAPGAFYSFPVTNARQMEIRRQDKSSTKVGVLARGLRTTKAPRSTDAIVMFGDSMVGWGGIHGLSSFVSEMLAPRVFTGISWPGNESLQIVAGIQDEIRGLDRYRGRLHAFFHGTPNLNDFAQVRQGALEMASLTGARDGRCVFLSVIGQLEMQWTGSRMGCIQFEDAAAGLNPCAELERWYERAFPGQLLNSRAELVTRSASRTTPSLHFPGQTEGAIASLYGILPLSYFFPFASMPWTPEGLTFQGYWNVAGLPSGGADGDYWIRTGSGMVGNLIVRWAGAWTEHAYDVTHMTPAGNYVLAQAFVDFLTANSL
jgi:hypothetical protein